jgi:hypothetical protein
MTFEEVLREWVARKLGKPIDPEDEVLMEWQESAECPTCGYSGFVAVRWSTKAPRRSGARWTFRDEEMLGLTKELVVLALDLEGTRTV